MGTLHVHSQPETCTYLALVATPLLPPFRKWPRKSVAIAMQECVCTVCIYTGMLTYGPYSTGLFSISPHGAFYTTVCTRVR